jgi:hypothetical protein
MAKLQEQCKSRNILWRNESEGGGMQVVILVALMCSERSQSAQIESIMRFYRKSDEEDLVIRFQNRGNVKDRNELGDGQASFWTGSNKKEPT